MTIRPRGPYIERIFTGVVLALYATDETYDFEIQRAPDAAGAPGSWETIADKVRGTTPMYTDGLPKSDDIFWYRARHTGFGDTPSDWTGSVSATPDIIPAGVQRPPKPALALRNFRETTRDPASEVATFTWRRDPRQDAVDVWENVVVGTLSSSPWPEPDAITGVYPDPALTLSDLATSLSLDIPSEGVRYALAVPRDASGRPGTFRRITIGAAGVLPSIYGLTQVIGASGLFCDVSVTVSDSQGLGGSLRAWVNHDDVEDADIAGLADGTATIVSTEATVTAATLFSGVALLDNIRVHPGRGKKIAFEFINSIGVSSGVQTFTLLSEGAIIDEDGHLLPGPMADALAYAITQAYPTVGPTFPVSPATNDMHYLTAAVGPLAARKLYRWTGAAWVKSATVDGGDLIANTITAGAIAAGAITASAISAGAVQAVHLSIAVLSDIATNAGIIVAGVLQSITGAVKLDLNATGVAPVLDAIAFTIFADGSATFSGTVTSNYFSANGATFVGGITLGDHFGVPGGTTTLAFAADATLFLIDAYISSTANVADLSMGGNGVSITARGNNDISLSLGGSGSLLLPSAVQIAGNAISFGAADSAAVGYRIVQVPN